jgi:hypothetical protein
MSEQYQQCSISISAPASAYSISLPKFGNGFKLIKVEDLVMIPSDKLTAFMTERNIKYCLEVNPKRFETHCDIHVMIVFDNETDAVMFKLQWEE